MAISYTSLDAEALDTPVQLLGKINQRLGTLAAVGDTETILLQKLLNALNAAAAGAAGTNPSGDFAVNPIWSDGAIHTGFKVNVTDISSDVNSKYVDFQIGGVSRFFLDKTTGFTNVVGTLSVNGFTLAKITDTGTGTNPTSLELYHDTSTGTPTSFQGVSLDFSGDSATVNRRLQGRISTFWTDPTDASRTARFEFISTTSNAPITVLRLSNAGLDLRSGTPLLLSGVAYFNPTAVYASGTVYTLTASSAAVTFGSISPATTLGSPGNYRISARVKIALNGATFGANQTITLKLRRTNNTATDLGNSSTTYIVPIMTTITNTLAIVQLPEIFYSGSSTDNITIFADISALPSAGSVSIDEASIHLVRIN